MKRFERHSPLGKWFSEVVKELSPMDPKGILKPKQKYDMRRASFNEKEKYNCKRPGLWDER